MAAYTEDTWILNVATNSIPDQDKFMHYCRIELPSNLSQAEAKIRAEAISGMIVRGCEHPLARWDFKLTRLEIRSYSVEFGDQHVSW